jgi:hypothetical protein
MAGIQKSEAAAAASVVTAANAAVQGMQLRREELTLRRSK